MNYRKLRIAWSVLWGVACLVLIVLWVRSYSRWDEVTWSIGTRHVWGWSLRGQLTISGAKYDANVTPSPLTWRSYGNFRVQGQSLTADDGVGGRVLESLKRSGPLAFGITVRDGGGKVRMPHCFPAVLMLAVAAVPWFRWRYSLRTLLIGMTLIAVLLGAIVYAVR